MRASAHDAQSDSRGGTGSLAFNPPYALGRFSVIMPGRDIRTAHRAKHRNYHSRELKPHAPEKDDEQHDSVGGPSRHNRPQLRKSFSQSC
jgi:hypothetical protein